MHDKRRPQSSSGKRQWLQDTVPIEIPALDEVTPSVPPAERPEVIIVAGMLGAGRSRATNALGDPDWYVMDNLSPQLLPALSGMMATVNAGVHRLTAVVDVRSREFLSHFVDYLRKVHNNGTDVRLTFLDVSDVVLARRFEFSRRPRPLQGSGSVLDGIEHERTLLGGLRGVADSVIDTFNYSVHDLARWVRELVTHGSDLTLRINVMSFGFKYGIPLDADHVLDVRFTPNPYRVSELRHLAGRDALVADYVFAQEGAAVFVDSYAGLFIPAPPQYVDGLKPHVILAMGCTGSKHRSVASAERLGARSRRAGFEVVVQHRDLGWE